jgi:hypothetical protein
MKQMTDDDAETWMDLCITASGMMDLVVVVGLRKSMSICRLYMKIQVIRLETRHHEEQETGMIPEAIETLHGKKRSGIESDKKDPKLVGGAGLGVDIVGNVDDVDQNL